MKSRAYLLHEANYRQVLDLKPNVAVLPWGATEAHNYHLPHGTDTIQAVALGEAAVKQANAAGARCILLPAIPFGNDNMQLRQAATITMRTATQHAVLRDVAESLVRQGIDRLVVLNYHGGNDFKQIIRDIMLDLPIFIVQINGYMVAECGHLLTNPGGDHANEFETCLLLFLHEEWVDMPAASAGAAQAFKLRALVNPAVWAPRDWESLTRDTGVGDPRAATAEKGQKMFHLLVDALVPMLAELSAAKNGDFPYVIRKSSNHA